MKKIYFVEEKDQVEKAARDIAADRKDCKIISLDATSTHFLKERNIPFVVPEDYFDRLERAVGSLGSEASIRSGILDGFEAANHAVLDLGIGAATTLAVAEIDADRVRAYHVGDSGIVVTGQRGRIKLQTMAHSPVGYAIEAGVLDEDEALHHEERHVVSNLVGSADMRIEVGSSLALADRDSLLLATDGLFDNLSLAEIVEIVRAGPLGAAACELAARCRARMHSGDGDAPSKPDDVTFALYRRGTVR